MLEIKHVYKKIRGNQILEDINFSAEGGKVYGIVGKNGSGKTMLFRAISGLMKIDEGEICFKGKLLHRDFDILPGAGIVLENAGLYPQFTGYKNLRLLGAVNGKIGDEQICRAIERVGLDPHDRRPLRKYSLGMKQRIVIAQAIMEQPDVLMLDEPTRGLDDDGVEQIRKIIQEEKERGAIVLITSHIREDIDLLSDEIYLMKQGILSREGGGGR